MISIIWFALHSQSMPDKRVTVIGLGYVGLALACRLAEKGFSVHGIDKDAARVEQINEKINPIKGEEPGLSGLISRMVEGGKLVSTTDTSLIEKADAVFICVNTPLREDNSPDLSALKSATTEVGRNLSPDSLVSVESTIPPGTMTNSVVPLLEEASGLTAGTDFSVVHCPERVMPGRLLLNMRTYSRVLGGLDRKSLSRGREYYSRIVEAEIYETDLTSAEITKTAENAYRDVQIAFANEVALLCEETGANAYEIRELVNTAPFRDMHVPGSGVGGHCIPKDPWLLVSAAPEKMRLVPVARRVNDSMPFHLVALTREAVDHETVPENPKISILGLGFLGGSGEKRNSPAKVVIDSLIDDFRLVVHDPYVEDPYRAPLTDDVEVALEDSDCAVFVTDHSLYHEISLEDMFQRMNTPIIIDGRNIFGSEECKRAGFVYRGIGKG